MDEQLAARKVTQLMRMEEAAREVYDAAMGKLPGSKIHPSMERFRHTHQEHAEGLRAVVNGMQGEPQGNAAHQVYMQEVVDAVRQTRDLHGLLSTMRTVEAGLRLEYEDAVGLGLPEDAQRKVRAYLRDEEEMPNLLNIASHGLAKA